MDEIDPDPGLAATGTLWQPMHWAAERWRPGLVRLLAGPLVHSFTFTFAHVFVRLQMLKRGKFGPHVFRVLVHYVNVVVA